MFGKIQGLIDRLSYNVVRYGDGYSIYDYIENYADIQSKTSLEYVQGLFGGMNKNVTTYYCGHPDFEIISEMVNDIETVYKQNGEALEQEIREYASKCVKYINAFYILYLEEIEKNDFLLTLVKYIKVKSNRETISNEEIDKKLKELYRELKDILEG